MRKPSKTKYPDGCPYCGSGDGESDGDHHHIRNGKQWREEIRCCLDCGKTWSEEWKFIRWTEHDE